MPASIFPIQLQLRIDWSDLDYLGHVNNISFFKFIQSARVNYFNIIGLMEMHKEENLGPILASCKCDFKKEMFFPGNVCVKTRVESIKNTSFTVYHQLFNDNAEITAEAHDVIVMFDFSKNIKIPVPLSLRQSIEDLENRVF